MIYTERERLENRQKALYFVLADIRHRLQGKDFKDCPGLVKFYEEELQRAYAEMHCCLPKLEEIGGNIRSRLTVFECYISARTELEKAKEKLKEAHKQAMPTSSTGLENSAKPPAAKSMNTFYKERMWFFSEFRNIVTFESCPKLSRSERILWFIENFDTAIIAARTVTAEGNLLTDELLVSLAMSKLDEDTLTQVTQHCAPGIIPTWAVFRELLLGLTTTAPSVQS